MNVGYGKYHQGGPTCTYKGGIFTCLVGFSEGGGISGHILTNIIKHLNDLKLYYSYRENGIISGLLVDGHGSRFDIVFLKYRCDENHKWTVFLVLLVEHQCGK